MHQGHREGKMTVTSRIDIVKMLSRYSSIVCF